MSADSTSPVRIATFRNFWLAGSVANFGTVILTVAASWQMTLIAQSAQQVAMVQTFAALPIVLLSIAAGAVADIMDRRMVMIMAQSFTFCASCGLTLLVASVGVSPPLLLLFVFVIGCGTAIHNPAWQASVGDQVPAGNIPSAVALNSLGVNLSRSLGPGLGGVLIAAGGVSVALAASALSCVGLLAALLIWKPPDRDTTIPRESLRSAMVGGIRFAKLAPRVPSLLLRGFLFGAGAGALPALMPVIAQQRLGGAALTFGLLLGAYGTGSVAGALASSRVRERFPVEMLVRWSSIVFALSSGAVAFSTNSVLTAAVLLPAGAAWVFALLTLNVSLQLSVPRWIVGRVLALFQMVVFAGISGGSWIWGYLAQDHGPTAALLISSLVLLACSVVGFWIPVEDPGTGDLASRAEWSVPQTAVPVPGRSGPVVIEIHWRIANEDVPLFAQLMLGRRRMFSRNGAHFWTLAHDTLDQESWIERYETATWFDYLRLNERITRDDAGYYEKLIELETTGHGPSVRRMIVRHPRTLLTGSSHASSDVNLQQSSNGF